MFMPVKAAAGVAAAIMAVTGAYWTITRTIQMQEYTTIWRAEEMEKYKDGLGEEYGFFMVSANAEDNLGFWRRSYNRWLGERDENLSSIFTRKKNVVTAFAGEDSEHEEGERGFNGLCEEAYLRSKEIEGETEEERRKLVHNMFTYCSLLEGVPTTIGEKSPGMYPEGTIGHGGRDKLIDVEGNSDYWRIKNEEFVEVIWPEKGGRPNKSLKNQCSDSYASQIRKTEDAPTLTEALKYCSLLGS